MIILGIDPGIATLGYGIIEKDARGSCRAIDCGVVVTPKEESLPVRLAMLEEGINKILEKFDAVYVPASPTIAPKFGEVVGDKTDGDFLAIDNHLGIANFAGLPSITLPIGFKENMPFGANLTCKPFEEAKLLNIAKNLEKNTGFANIFAKKEEK